MARGLKATFELLAHTCNEAAVAVLIPALDSADASIQERALRAIMKRRSPAGQHEVLSRLHVCDERWKEVIRECPGRMTSVLRDAVLDRNRQMCVNACQAILWFREYDLTAALITAAESESNPNADSAAATIVELAERLYDELSGPRDYRERRDPRLIRQHVVNSLEESVKRYPRHNRREVMDAFLLLAGRENAVLKHILHDPHHACYLPIVDRLTNCRRAGVQRLVLSFLDDPRAPSATLSVLAHRVDLEFLERLLDRMGADVPDVVVCNLKRVESIGWLRDKTSLIDQLNDARQASLVQLVMASGLRRLEAFKTIRYLVRHGTPGGRRAASAVLAAFSGAEANQLTQEALDDPDPQVQAAAAGQLRQHGLPGAMTRLIQLVDSPHAVVSEVARAQLTEFSLERFLAAFDGLADDVRRSTGRLVRKIDVRALPGLVEEMSAPARSRRLRAVSAAQALAAVAELEQPLLALLEDDDHMVRTETARVLVECDTPSVRQALRRALADRSVTVQMAARHSLDQLGPADDPPARATLAARKA